MCACSAIRQEKAQDAGLARQAELSIHPIRRSDHGQCESPVKIIGLLRNLLFISFCGFHRSLTKGGL